MKTLDILLTSRGMKAGISVLDMSLPASTSCAAAATTALRGLAHLACFESSCFLGLTNSGALQCPQKGSFLPSAELTAAGRGAIKMLDSLSDLPLSQVLVLLAEQSFSLVVMRF